MEWFFYGMALLKFIANAFVQYCAYAALFNQVIDKEFLPTLFKVK
jgi:hypothetical protein